MRRGRASMALGAKDSDALERFFLLDMGRAFL
jgi:hypothetical protein